jgi:hypothetical protein
MQSFLQRNPEFCWSYNFGDARLCQKYEQFSVQYCPTHKTNLFEGSQASPARASYKRSIKMKISTEHWWNDTDRGKLKCWEKNLSLCYLIQTGIKLEST